ncbi:DUF2950 family protein [Edaphobacter sp. HDX4]|uniref:DUF2950 family protein n=1 Tax=Edaphobacter sp. HDX4 TaxID=2794064 RepID=UPI002FE53281
MTVHPICLAADGGSWTSLNRFPRRCAPEGERSFCMTPVFVDSTYGQTNLTNKELSPSAKWREGGIVKDFMMGASPCCSAGEYGVTGIQTFIVSNDGVVYQKDSSGMRLPRIQENGTV